MCPGSEAGQNFIHQYNTLKYSSILHWLQWHNTHQMKDLQVVDFVSRFISSDLKMSRDTRSSNWKSFYSSFQKCGTAYWNAFLPIYSQWKKLFPNTLLNSYVFIVHPLRCLLLYDSCGMAAARKIFLLHTESTDNHLQRRSTLIISF